MPDPSQTGMYLRDLLNDRSFRERRKLPRVEERGILALRRLSSALSGEPDAVLQQLVDTAVELCAADSAGISLEDRETETFEWIVIAGSFQRYRDGRTPRHYSPCGTCLDAGRPQLCKVSQPYYDYLGVIADPITDGILIPWTNGVTRGTIWAVSHSSDEAFTIEDYELLSSLSGLAAVILGHHNQHRAIQDAERARGVVEMANRMAHRINNPLQSLTNTIFLARRGGVDIDEQLAQAELDLKRLSEQVASLLNTAKESF